MMGVTTIAAVAVALLATAAPASAGMNDYPFRLLGSLDGNSFSSDVINMTVRSKPKSVYFKGVNKTGHKQHIQLLEDSFGSGTGDYNVRWFRGDTEITSAVRRIDGYEFGLKKRASKIFRARVKAIAEDPGAMCLSSDWFVQPDAYEVSGSAYVNGDGVCG